MEKFKSKISSLTPKICHYRLLISTPTVVIDHLAERCKNHCPYLLSVISYDMLPLIEKSRPGYSEMVKRYLDNEHIGFCIIDQDCIASMAWLFYNNRPYSVKVTYYPLPPKRAWFHAAWTHPSYRGRGFHKILIYYRALYIAKYLTEQSSLIFIEANIDPHNFVSFNNYKKCGFSENGDIYVFSFLKGCFSWKRSMS